MKARKRVSDIISEEDIQNWNNGDVVTIRAGTGAGKSYFVKNKLYEVARKNGERILMLIHRRNCVDQFKYELERDDKSDVVDVRTYQSLEMGFEVDLSGYGYIVSDEFHYFLSDANFSITTDISLDRILKADGAIRLFMSATGDYMTMYLKNVREIDIIEYELEDNFDFINALVFYNQDKTVENFIDRCLETDDKMILFMNDTERALELYNKYKEHSLFNCSESNKYYRHVNEKKIHDMLQNERFEEQLLITTSVMEAGVNIKDKQVKHIVVDIEDFVVLTQCLGRRRIDWEDEDDKINLFVRDISKQKLEGRIRNANAEMEQAEYLKEHGEVEFAKKYGRQISGNSKLYLDANEESEDGDLIMNVAELSYLKHHIDNVIREDMKSRKNGYKDYVKERFDVGEYYLQEKLDEKAELVRYLEGREGDVMLNVKDRKELIEMVNVRDGDNNRLIRGIGAINDSLEQNDIPFVVVQSRKTIQDDEVRKDYSAAWTIMSTELNKGGDMTVSSTGSIEDNIKDLEIGVRYKYKDLLKILNEDFKSSGRSRNLQFKRWSDYFEIYKPRLRGQEYIVKEIYKT